MLRGGGAQRLGVQGAGGMAAVNRADSVGSEKSSVVDTSAKREPAGDELPSPAVPNSMKSAAGILVSLSSP